MPNIHDRWFKRTFKKRSHAIALLRAVLPKELVRSLDFRTLKSRDTHSIDKIISERESDLLFEVKFRTHWAFVFLLFEHQSKVDPWMLFRLLQAMVRIWEEYRASNPEAKTLPLIVPIVLHHSQQGWTSPTSFEQLYDVEPEVLAVLRNYVPCFTMVLDDISLMSEEQLRAHVHNAYVQLALRVMQKVRVAPNAQALMSDLASLIEQVLNKPHGREFLIEMLHYILQANQRLNEQELTKDLAKMSKKSQDKWQELVMTAAKRLRDEGYQEGERVGEQRGLLEGKRSMLFKMLQLKFRKVPKWASEHVQKSSLEQFDRYVERVLTASSIREVLEG